jgi:putative FmdB family regulatory protein
LLYEYECSECDYIFEIKQSIHEDPIKICPECSAESARRVLHPPNLICYTSDVKSLGLLASRNARKMGKQLTEERFRQDKEHSRVAKKAAREQLRQKLPAGATLPEPGGEAPWYRKGTEGPDTSLAKMTPEQTKKYINEGKKPIPVSKS